MLFLTLFSLFLQFQILNGQVLDVNGVSLAEKVLAIERLMLTPGTIDFQVAPCAFALNGSPPGFPNPTGDQTAAQWVRTVFHDFITANVAAGTGGLDASIGFESSRAENLGNVFTGENFIDRTIIGFNLFSSLFISTSDFIALGLAEAVLSCDPNSPMIQLRAGRIDATAAGPLGVPGPGDSFASQKAAFAKAGFNQTEMIQAVACGHSIGGVHGINFPEIVGSQTTFGTTKVDTFDDTPYVFDVLGVQRYLSGTGKAGGPLVTTKNTTFQSDARIFKSDGNATIRALAASQTSFENTCFKIFEKMINTVPRTVTLSDVIGPRKWITMHSNLDLTSTGAVTYSGSIGTYSKTGSPSTASYLYGTEGGGNTGPKTSQVGVLQSNIIDQVISSDGTFIATRFPFFGNTTFYSFSDIIDSKVTSMTIQGTYTEAINQKLFVVPSLSFVNPGAGPKYLVRAALLTSLAPAGTTLTATLYYAAAQAGSTSPVYKQQRATLLSYTKLGSYTLFSGTITKPGDPFPTGGVGGSEIDVQLGTTLRSPKAHVGGNPTAGLFSTCTNDDLTTC